MMQYDKKIHFIGSFIVCLGLMQVVNVQAAVIATAALGITKELIYDWALGKGTPEWGDLAADAAGILGAVIVRGVM